MSYRRFSLAAALILTVAVAVALAQPQVTVVLTNGQQYTGSLAYRNNTVGVFTTSGLRSWPASSVALVEFTPGQPDPNEIEQLPTGTSGGLITSRNSSAVLVLQDGQVVTGTLAAISSDGNQVTMNTSNGRDNYMANDIARLYLNPAAAQRLLASNGINRNPSSLGAVGTSGQSPLLNGAQTISVAANAPWTSTGIQVRAGDRIAVRATGQIHWAPQANEVAGPQGGNFSSPNYPVPSARVGALIGRVGNSQPFAVPASGQITAPASGELMLGINDDNLSDNSGAFQVQVGRIGR